MLIPSEQDFAAAVALWREWNSRINVISRKDEDAIFAHHILHSLAIAQYLETFYTVIPSEAKETILDVGCGGGFPGIPLAMVMPEAKFTLCDSTGKKVKVGKESEGSAGGGGWPGAAKR